MTTPTLTNSTRFPSTPSPLAYGAIGDSYGFCFEFADASFVAKNNDLQFHRHPRFKIVPGCYSDDTQMQMALGEVIASGRQWTAENLAQAFVDVFKRDPREGYSKGFYSLLQQVSDGGELRGILSATAHTSEKNGAAMRSPILGLYPDLGEIVPRCEIQAKITHDTRVGVDSSIAAALMAHYFAYDLGPKHELPNWLDKLVPGHDWGDAWTGKVPVHGTITVRAAITAILRNDRLSDLLKDCVAFTGDVDSVATIALASASGHHGFVKDIPDALWDGFERSQFGMAYLQDLDARVAKVTGVLSKP